MYHLVIKTELELNWNFKTWIGIGIGVDQIYLSWIGIGIGIDHFENLWIGIGIGVDKTELITTLFTCAFVKDNVQHTLLHIIHRTLVLLKYSIILQNLQVSQAPMYY